MTIHPPRPREVAVMLLVAVFLGFLLASGGL
jgi:hypothetical protein